MDRIANTRTFTCKSCREKRERADLAMSTSQSGLCIKCYNRGRRIFIEWISQFAYITAVANADELTNPDNPRGAHNYMLDGSERNGANAWG